MTREEILKRLEEVEAQCAAMREALEKLKHCPELELEKIRAENYLDAWFKDEEARLEGLITQVKQALQSDAGRDLLDRLHKLEAVAEAAREIVKYEPHHRDYALSGNSDPRVCYYCEAPWEHKAPQHKPGCPLGKLQRALAALEEVSDE